MGEYKLSENMQGRMFFTHHSELEDRLDPLFYVAVQNIKENIVKKAKYECVDLIKICTINRGRFGHRPRNDPKFYGGNYPFIQTGDIVKAAESNNSIKYTQTLNELGLKTSKLFEPPKLLFTIAANIGDTAILDYSSCFPDSIVALIPNRGDISLEYLNAYLSLIKPYIVELAPYSAQRNLNNQQLAQVPVIIPPKSIQERIAEKVDAAYAAKKQQEAEAQQLLSSIDDYLLAELGIKQPEAVKNTLQSRIFTRKFKEVSGGRFDPKLYDCKTLALKSAINRSNCHKSTLKELIISSIAGDWGRDVIDISDASLSKCLVIRATEFDNSFNLNLINARLKYRLINNDKLKKMDVQEGDLLIEKSGGSPAQPVGRVAILTKSIIEQGSAIGYSNFIQKIRVDKSRLLPGYLFCFLKTVHNIGLTDAMQSQTNGIRNLIMADYFNQKIPLPTISRQAEISSCITQLRAKARQLQQQAKSELEQAKKEVEAMILGGA